MREELQSAIENLYRAFAHYQRPASIQLCQQCYPSASMPGPGRDLPLRELPAEELEGLAGDFLTCAGDLDCFRHYLPRLFELVATHRYWVDMEILFKKLADPAHPYQGWPGPEREAIDAYFAALWRQLIGVAADKAIRSPDELLCAIWRAGANPITYLDSWVQSPGLVPIQNFREFLLQNNSCAQKGKLANAFWEAAGTKEILAWLGDPTLLSLLVERSDHAEPPEEREALDGCFDLVAALS